MAAKRYGYKASRFWKTVERLQVPMICVYCNVSVQRDLPPDHPNKATVDHLVPRSKGGTNIFENMVIACRPCNHKRKDQDFYE